MAGCGRIHFDPTAIGDAASSDVALDGGEPAGLLLHFAFEADGLAHDRAPAHHDATCTACPTVSAGRVGAGAASFTGGACLQIADAPDLRPAAFSYALWLEPRALAGVPQTAFSRPFQGATAGTNTFEMFVDAGDLWKVAINTQARALALDHATWHHVAGTFDGNAVTMYVDGTPRGAPLVVGPATYGADDLLIGCDLNSGIRSNQISGNVDDLRFYDHVLSQAEIVALAAM